MKLPRLEKRRGTFHRLVRVADAADVEHPVHRKFDLKMVNATKMFRFKVGGQRVHVEGFFRATRTDEVLTRMHLMPK